MKIKKNKTYIIAEIGINHEGSFKNAIKLIREAAISGADAVKFQIFKPETLASKESQKTNDQKKRTKKKESLYQMWKRMEFTLLQWKKLKALSKKLKLDFISSVFDKESFELSKKINLSAYKVASSDLTDVKLLTDLSFQKKPIIISTGMGSFNEIKKALNILKKNKAYLLHCVSLYPCPTKLINLNRMKTLSKKFNKDVGYSDHSLGINASLISISMGAKILEIHFTLDKNQKGADHELSVDPNDLKIISDFSNKFYHSIGSGKIEPHIKEKKMRKFFRKSIHAKKNISVNEKLTETNLVCRRPQNSIKSELYFKILNKKTNKDILIDQPIYEKNIK
jgi:N,N'-diacetyllegionaminate synthase